MMFYSDPKSPGLEFHLGRSTREHVRAGPAGLALVLLSPKAICAHSEWETGTPGPQGMWDSTLERTFSGWPGRCSLNNFRKTETTGTFWTLNIAPQRYKAVRLAHMWS